MILCCGEALIDMLPRVSKEGAAVYQPFIGGSIFNTTIALGRLGHEVGLFGGISTDFFGDMLVEGLKASHVSQKYLLKSDRPTMLAFVKLSDGHARYSFLDENAASRMITKKDLPKLPASVTALHCGSVSLISEPGGTAFEALVKREAKRRVICIDPNIRPILVKDRKAYLARLKRLTALADIVKISDEDTKWMTGSADLDKAAKAWLRAGAKIVAMTRGGDGVIAYTKRFRIELPAVKVKVADTVGAGDTFTAGLLISLSRAGLLGKTSLAVIGENDLRKALAFAARAAAITVSRPGADPPWAKEMGL